MAARTKETPYRVVTKDAPHESFGKLEVEFIPIRRFKEVKRNARTHSKKQIEQIVSSIRRFGWTCPLLVDEHGNIIAGHGRLQAAIRLGLAKVPAIVIAGLSDTEKRALALADNKIAANAGWDRAILATELSELSALLPECGLKLDITGFEPAEVDSLLGDHIDPERDPVDEPPPVAAVAVSRIGDLWQLCRHRLLCGDARTAADYDILMRGKLAAAVSGDPPFNVRLSSIGGRGKIKHREFVAGSGELSSDAFTAFLRKCFRLAAQHSVEGSLHYFFMDWRHLREILDAGNAVYGNLRNLIVWSKTNAGQGSLYRSQHELIFLFRNGDAQHLNNIELGKHGRNRTNIWSYAGVNTFRAGRLDELSVHPTVKPVALIADAMRDCTRRDDIVLDPFMGSGTTIVAAERVGRRCYGLELDPHYVDVAIRRWQFFTKCDAVLQSTGQTFDEVAASRMPRVRLRSRK